MRYWSHAAAVVPACAAMLLAWGPAEAAQPSDAPAGFEVAAVFDLQPSLAPDEYLWELEGAPAAPLRIVVDISAERLFVYRGGIEIGRSYIIHGEDPKPTPLGVFRILDKDIDHVSSTYAGAPMPYNLRLTKDGVAIHGAEVDPRFATHGCIGVENEFAALLFEQARVGDHVLITRNWRPDLYGPWTVEDY